MISILIVDDEKLARLELKNLLNEINTNFKIIGEAKNGKEAVEMIDTLKPDVVFMDIQMPEFSGFDVLKKISHNPRIVFTTAYDEFALDAFKANALDYLLKPIDIELLKLAVEKIDELENEDNEFQDSLVERKQKSLGLNDRIFIKDRDKLFFPFLKDVRFFESKGNYVRVHFNDQKPMILKSLNSLEERLDHNLFFRANRKFIVNLEHIKEIESWFNGGLKLFLNSGETIEVSRRQAIRFKDYLSL